MQRRTPDEMVSQSVRRPHMDSNRGATWSDWRTSEHDGVLRSVGYDGAAVVELGDFNYSIGMSVHVDVRMILCNKGARESKGKDSSKVTYRAIAFEHHPPRYRPDAGHGSGS